MKSKVFWFAVVFFVFTVVMRFVPHSPNFVPVGALALFAGAYLPKKWGLLVPITAMFVSDIFIGFYNWKLMAVVYVSFALMVAIGWLVRRNNSVPNIAIGAVSGAVLFFLVTNFAVWMMSEWYPATFQGLLLSYTMALPFFRNTLMAGLFYSGVFFGAYAFAGAFWGQVVALYERRRLAVSQS